MEVPQEGKYVCRLAGQLVIYEATTGSLCAAVPCVMVDTGFTFKHTLVLVKSDGTIQTKTTDTLKAVFGWDGVDPFWLMDSSEDGGPMRDVEFDIVGGPETGDKGGVYLRHRSNLVAGCGRQVQHMQRALDQMNIHLHHVVSDLDGDTGLAILDAILAGERDPKELVKLRHPRCSKSTVAEMAAALKGDWREEHLFVLQQSLESYRALQRQIVECDRAMEKVLERVAVNPSVVSEAERPTNPVAQPPAVKPKRKKRTRGNAPQQDLTAQLHRICGVDLTRIVGFNVLSVLILISEIGVDMSRWRNAKAFCAWLGLCPGNKISGGKVLSSRTARVVNRVAILLRTLAPTLARTDTWLGSFHRRMKARLGPAAANTATARKLATLVYHLLKYKEEYIDVDRLVYEEKFRRYRVSRLRRQAEELGYEIAEIKEAA
jgi:transposase